MAEVVLLADRLLEAVDRLEERVHAKEWSAHSRPGFLHALKGTVAEMGEITSLLRMLKDEFSRGASGDAPDVSVQLTELQSILELLKRNMEIEGRHVESARDEGDVLALAPAPMLYSELERKVLAALLKTRYLAERVQIFERKHSGYAPGADAARTHAFGLLDAKERELQELREKYEELRSAPLGKPAEEHAVLELENELNECARKLESESAVLREGIAEYAKQFERIDSAKSLLESRLGRVEELSAKQTDKAFELITALKRERDYAKKLFMGVEGETLKLRGAYSKKLLSLEEEKASAMDATSGKAQKRLKKLEKELAEKDELLKHLKRSLDEKQETKERVGAWGINWGD